MTDAANADATRTSAVELPSDPQMQAVIAVFQQHLGEPMRQVGAEQVRIRRAALRSSARPAVELAEVRDLAVPGRSGDVPARLYRPHDGPAAGVVVHLHGGGWVLGSLDESDTFCRVFAGISGCDVVSVDYRLAPEHPYPAAVEDADDAVRWIARELAADAPLVLMGDSAGGTLVAAVARHARDEGGPAVALQVLVYPVLDHRMSTPSYTERGGKLLISADDMDWFWSQYVPEAERRAEPDASPGLVADLSGLAPALFVVAEFDPIRDEALDYAARLEDAGVPTTVLRYDTVAHGFFPMTGTLAVADDAIRAVGLAVSDACRAANALAGR